MVLVVSSSIPLHPNYLHTYYNILVPATTFRHPYLMVRNMYSSYSWDHGVHPTYIVTSADLVISVFSPALPPWVLYDPERLFLKPNGSIRTSTIAYEKNSMIQVLAADVWAWDTTNICLHKNCIDTNCTTKSKSQCFLISDSIYLAYILAFSFEGSGFKYKWIRKNK